MEAVIAPAMCGIGGYAATGVGFLARPGRLVALDANAVAPAAARADMFAVVPGRDPNEYRLADDRHKVGPLAVAVPGVLAGLVALQKNWGKLDCRAVVAPAVRRAREGVELTPGAALTWLRLEARAEGGREPSKEAVPKRLKMPALADTLEAVAEEGADVFYKGRIGRAIAAHVRALGGILTADDMASYRPLVVEPVTVAVRGHLLATPPPGSGGLSSLQMAALFDRLDRAGKAGDEGSAGAFEAWLEVDKVVWEERLLTLADARTMARPPADLLTDGHLERLLVRVLEGLRDPRPGRIVAPDPLRGTSHIAAADGDGNLVAWTQTHGGGFGAQVMVKGTGVVLGHGMCRFEPRPGWPNSVAPGKRPLHNMGPTVIVKDGKAVLALGATGGRTIVNNVAAIAAGRLVVGLDPAPALAAPRLQCETIEPAVLERSAGPAVFDALRARRHRLREVNRDPGSAHLIARDADGWVGVPEPRLATAAAVGA
jgi:gamma-glutamyltranspeptidase/glutathione hydrolase